MSLAERAKALVELSRPPFLLVGLFPFAAGLALAEMQGFRAAPGLSMLSAVGLTLIMLATYYSNEYFDYQGDVINVNRNRFSGGTRVFPEGRLPRAVGLQALAASLTLLASLLALYVYLYFSSRPLLLPMALAGVLMGVLYSAPPGRWAYRGLGEVLIGIAYGWLATVSGYYVAAGSIPWQATVLSLPAAFSIFAVIVVNEFPDYEADRVVSKRNLVVRLGGPFRARYLYAAAVAASAVSAVYASLSLSGSLIAALITAALYTPLAFAAAYMSMKDEVLADTKGRLERLCALTIVLNLVAPYSVLIPYVLLR